MAYKDPLKQKQAQAEHYQNNKTIYRDRLKARRAATQQFVDSIKLGKCCKFCSEDDVCCLDFHHRNPDSKAFTITFATKSGYAESRLLEEIEKCDIVCANCHLSHHKTEYPLPTNKRGLRNSLWLRQYKSDKCCSKCGETNSATLCFHHLGEKSYCVSDLVVKGFAIARIEAEIAKCEILCANCHRKEHQGNVWADLSVRTA